MLSLALLKLGDTEASKKNSCMISWLDQKFDEAKF